MPGAFTQARRSEGGTKKAYGGRIVETESEELSMDEEEINRTAAVRRWNSGVPRGGIQVLNRLNTDTRPGPPSVESIPVRNQTREKQEANW